MTKIDPEQFAQLRSPKELPQFLNVDPKAISYIVLISPARLCKTKGCVFPAVKNNHNRCILCQQAWFPSQRFDEETGQEVNDRGHLLLDPSNVVVGSNGHSRKPCFCGDEACFGIGYTDSMFSFPSDKEIRQQWYMALGDNLTKETKDRIDQRPNNHRLAFWHFSPDHLEKDKGSSRWSFRRRRVYVDANNKTWKLVPNKPPPNHSVAGYISSLHSAGTLPSLRWMEEGDVQPLPFWDAMQSAASGKLIGIDEPLAAARKGGTSAVSSADVPEGQPPHHFGNTNSSSNQTFPGAYAINYPTHPGQGNAGEWNGPSQQKSSQNTAMPSKAKSTKASRRKKTRTPPVVAPQEPPPQPPSAQDEGLKELLCDEELPNFLELGAFPAFPFSSAAAEEVAAAASGTLQQTKTASTRGAKTVAAAAGKKQPPAASSAAATAAVPLKKKKRRKPDHQEPSIAAEFALQQQQQQQQQQPQQQEEPAPPTIYVEDPNVSYPRHTMCDWTELGLGERTGSAAWNNMLRAQLIRSHPGTLSVPQLSSAECLFRVQQTLQLPTILPPEDSFLVAPPNSKKPRQSAADSFDNDEEHDKDGEDGDQKMAAAAATTSSSSSRREEEDLSPTLEERMRDLYREMVFQDVNDGNDFRRELRFTSAAEMGQRMKHLDRNVVELETRERNMRERLLASGSSLFANGDMQQRVARLRGMV